MFVLSKLRLPLRSSGACRLGTVTEVKSGQQKESTFQDNSDGRLGTSKTPSQTKEGSMEAWQVYSYGGLDQLKLNQVQIPIITKPKDVLVKVMAASVNPLDLYMTSGYGNVMLGNMRQLDSLFQEPIPNFPLTPGRDFSGRVVAKGNGSCSKIMVDDMVYGVVPPHMQGCHAQYVVANESMLNRVPQGFDLLGASSLLYTGLTAWSSLMVTGDLWLTSAKKKKVLVIGASGGVGTIAVQLLKHWGAQVVATCSSDAFTMVSSLGADTVLSYSLADSIQQILNAGKYDIVLDCSGVCNPTTYAPMLKDWTNSKIICLRSPMLKNTDALGLIGGMFRNISDLVFSNVASGAPAKGSTVRWGFFLPFPMGIQEIGRLYAEKKIKPVVGEVFKFKDLPKAYERVKQGHLRGKVVLDLSD